MESSLSKYEQIRAELEETRQAYYRLLDEVTEADWHLPSGNPAWTIGEMMYHITVATQNIPADIAIIRKAPWLPNPPVRLLHLFNPPLTRWGASKYNRGRLPEKFERDHASLLSLLETIQEDEWEKGRKYRAYDPPLLDGFVTIEDLFHYQKYHLEQHAKDIRSTLDLLRVANYDGVEFQIGVDTVEPTGGSELSPGAATGREMLPYPGGGWLRTLFRAPIPLWRLGLGPVLGKIMMLITHTGRKSGRIRRTMVEYHARDGVKYVAAAWGEKADWYLNIRANPYITIQTADGIEHVKAGRVTDVRELLSVYTLFMRRDPPLSKWYLQSKGIDPTDPADFLAKKDRLYFVRFAPEEFPATEPTLPPVHADLKWVLPALGATLAASWLFLKNRRKS